MAKKCFYHRDSDGHCAGAIVKWQHPETEMHSIDYRDERSILDHVKKGDIVYIVDFGPQPGTMEEVLKKIGKEGKVVWIDHHESTLKKYESHRQFLALRGIRRVGDAGCLLTWEYFMGKVAPPLIVKLIDDWDTWKHEMDPLTNYVQAGLTTMDSSPDNQEFWSEHLGKKTLSYLSQESALGVIIERGMIITNQRKVSNQRLIKEWSFPVDWEGLSWCAMNFGKGSSQMFDFVKDQYEGFITFIFDGEKYTVSLYSDREEVDVSEIAVRYNGGGHKGAAGFVCTTLPFVKKSG